MSKEIKIKVAELKQNKLNEQIYCNISEDSISLVEQIKSSGYVKTILIKPDNTIISGHRRVSACKELNIDTIDALVISDKTELEYDELFLLENSARIKTTEQIVREYKFWKEIETKKAALREKAGVRPSGENHPRVNEGRARDLAAEKLGKKSGKVMDETSAVLDSIDKVSNKEIKKDLRDIFNDNITDAKKLLKLPIEKCKNIVDKVKSKEAKDVKEAVNQLKKEEAKEKLEEVSKTFVDNKEIKIFNTDFRETAKTIKDNSVDLILTDPPYPKEFLPLWNDLAVIANRVLKPSGFLICYSGQIYLEEIMNYFTNAGLKYYWLGGLWHKGATAIVQGRNVINEMKPILFYQKLPFKKSKNTFCDLFTNDKQEKALHEWQQGIVTFKTIIERFTEPNDLIFEPFAGSGTTLVAAKELKRKCIGCEVDVSNINIIKGRLS